MQAIVIVSPGLVAGEIDGAAPHWQPIVQGLDAIESQVQKPEGVATEKLVAIVPTKVHKHSPHANGLVAVAVGVGVGVAPYVIFSQYSI
jgi:hypothetical protein